MDLSNYQFGELLGDGSAGPAASSPSATPVVRLLTVFATDAAAYWGGNANAIAEISATINEMNSFCSEVESLASKPLLLMPVLVVVARRRCRAGASLLGACPHHRVRAVWLAAGANIVRFLRAIDVVVFAPGRFLIGMHR